MSSREDIEKLDVDAVADSPATRSLLVMLKALVLELMGLLAQLRDELQAREAENAELKAMVFGQRSERQRRSQRRPRRPLEPEETAARQQEGERKRRENRGAKKELPTEAVDHPVPATCPSCGEPGPFSELPPEVSYQVELVPAHLVRHRHVRYRAACACGQILSGDAPARVGDCAQYGPRLHAHAVVSKCADAMPLNRLSKRFGRAGVPMARSTLTDLFHRVAQLLRPVYDRLLALVAEAEHVNADETSQPVMDVDKCRKGFMWTFIAGAIVAYVFSSTRSGKTAERVLGESTGVLQVDGYTGYNHVTAPNKRVRAGCLAHVRRYFHKARDACPDEVEHVLELVRKLYRVEVDAAARGITGSPGHLALRRLRSKPLMDEWKPWLEERKPQHSPKSPMGKAVRYALNQWDCVVRFLDDPKIRLDNNISESALRIVALGRDNFRWVGNEQAGENLAVLQTLVSTCVACGVNPEDYLADVLLRVDTHPAAAIDDLLPVNWTPPS